MEHVRGLINTPSPAERIAVQKTARSRAERTHAITMNQVTSTIERSCNSLIVINADSDITPSVSADEYIRPETQSSIVTLDHRRLVHHNSQFKVTVRRGELLSNPSSNAWPFSMEVAAECRTQNVECSMVSPAPSSSSENRNLSLVFTTTRPIEKGQRLYFWFSEMMLAQLEMPFLVPKNIQAGDRYVCHRCSAVFTNPNPLKLHLFFHCSQRTVSLSMLWAQIYSALVKPSNEINLFVRHHKASSLFLPTLIHPVAHHHHPPGANPAQVETLVSHLGRSKHGHVCIYCGKIYSRKYGLKIHIRTHTGYKPLKCPVCSRPFGDPSNLNKHIRLHAEHQTADGDAPYKCEICGKILVRRRDLDRHMQSRHGSSHQASKTNSDSIECSSPLSEADSNSGGSNSSNLDDSGSDVDLDVVEI